MTTLGTPGTLDTLATTDGMTCRFCSGPLARMEARGRQLSSRDPQLGNCYCSIRLRDAVEVPVCVACDHAFALTPEDHTQLAAAEAAAWAVRHRRKLGVRIFRDDSISLGVSWVPCHDGDPVTLYLLGLCIAIGRTPGDEPRFRVWSWPSLRGLWRALVPDRDPGEFPETWSHEWEFRGYCVERVPLIRGQWDRWLVPGYLGLGVSVYGHRWQGNALSWHVMLHVAGWRGWIGRTVRRDRVTPRALADRMRRYFTDDED